MSSSCAKSFKIVIFSLKSLSSINKSLQALLIEIGSIVISFPKFATTSSKVIEAFTKTPFITKSKSEFFSNPSFAVLFIVFKISKIFFSSFIFK